MFVFGHMGIGLKLVSPWSEGLQKRWILFGTLLPDLIDKPIYYALSYWTGRHGSDLGLISGTRTFGHTALLLLIIGFSAMRTRSRVLAAIAFGMATHLVLDNIADRFAPFPPTTIWALLFPFLGFRFPVIPFESLSEHWSSALEGPFLWFEVIGLLLLGWEFWKSTHRKEILASLQERRQERHLRRLKRKHPELR